MQMVSPTSRFKCFARREEGRKKGRKDNQGRKNGYANKEGRRESSIFLDGWKRPANEKKEAKKNERTWTRTAGRKEGRLKRR